MNDKTGAAAVSEGHMGGSAQRHYLALAAALAELPGDLMMTGEEIATTIIRLIGPNPAQAEHISTWPPGLLADKLTEIVDRRRDEPRNVFTRLLVVGPMDVDPPAGARADYRKIYGHFDARGNVTGRHHVQLPTKPTGTTADPVLPPPDVAVQIAYVSLRVAWLNRVDKGFWRTSMPVLVANDLGQLEKVSFTRWRRPIVLGTEAVSP